MIIHADGWNTGRTVLHNISFEKYSDEYSSVEFAKEISFSELLKQCGLAEDGLFYYHYRVQTENGEISLGGEAPTELIRIENFIGERQLLIHTDDYRTSSGFSGGIVYHVFVDRFRSSGKCPVKEDAVLDPDWENGIPQYGEYPGAEFPNNVFFGGDLYGVIEKLDYIASLGTKTIYLSPVFDAFSNHKYDTGDYLTVDSMFGGDEALTELCSKAKARGINIILDGVFNHTGSDSVYFNKEGRYDSIGAYQSKESPYYGWYNFTEYPDEYESWWGVKILPRVSKNGEFQSFICGTVMDKWMNAGVSGWRLDVADELSDDFLNCIRKNVKSRNFDAVIIGEVWEDATDKVAYDRRRSYLRGGQLDSVMNYPLRGAIISYIKNGNCAELRKYTEGTYRRYPKQSSDNLLNFLGTHDTERILTHLGGESCGDHTNEELSTMRMTADEKQAAIGMLKLAYGIIGGLPGVPCVFYGDEVGMEGYRDPFCRRPFPWHDMNSDLLEYYRRIGNIRKKHSVFSDGLFRIISLTDQHFVYIRYPEREEGEKIIVAASRKGDLSLRLPRHTTDSGTGRFVSRTGIVRENEVRYFSCPAWTSVTASSLGL
ncbi:MAG: glycoside hydrolase family 13 protein [Clostridia bacterium]|nr:glycoside hydrolase family 13 protein [Clostridia bacterium]